MSGSASLDLERQMLAHTLAIAPMPTLARVYVALCQTAPTEAAGGSELAGAGYARTAATFALLSTPANAASNASAVDFAPATADWRPISHFELWTQATGGTRLYWGRLLDPTDGTPVEIDVLSGSAVRFSPGSLVVQAAEIDLQSGNTPWLPTGGGTMTGPLMYTATGGITSRSAQDRAAEVIYAEDYGVVPEAADNTAALQAFLAALNAFPGPVRAVLPSGTLYFTTALAPVTRQNFALVGAGMGATRLRYKGSNTTVDLMTFDQVGSCTVSDFTIDTLTVMTAGTALHIKSSSIYMSGIRAGGGYGAYHIGADGNAHSNLWNGIWFDMVGMTILLNFEAGGQNDGIRVNGGNGPKADLYLSYGKISGSLCGLRCGGGYGGLMVDNVAAIHNWNNFIADRTLANENNREIFFGPNITFDSSGYVGQPGDIGPVNPGGGAVGDNMVLNDTGGGFVVIKGWVVTALNNGNGIHVVAWGGLVKINGCTIAYTRGDGIRVDTGIPYISVSDDTNIHDVDGYGINQTVAMKAILGAPTFAVPGLGNLSPTTKIQFSASDIVASTLALGSQINLVAAGTVQTDATPITATYVTVATVPVGSGVVLPVATAVGRELEVLNNSATALLVYPPVGWSLYGGSTNIPIILPARYRGAFVCNITGAQYQVRFLGPINGNSIIAAGSFANDAAAAAGGVQREQLYRNGSIVMVRVA